jgi:hypothetical protein
MSKRNSVMAIAGIAAFAVGLSGAPASAYTPRDADVPATVTKVKVGGPRVAYSGQVMLDQTDLAGCKKNAWIIGHVKWTLGTVSKKQIEVRKIQVFYRTAVQSDVEGQFLIRGNGKTVWKTRWSAGPVKGDSKDHSQTYTIKKTVPLDGKPIIKFQSNVNLGQTGGPADCGGETFFWYELKPVS